ncbi:MAG: NAD(P)H-hydrate dehydratase [Egibacteraceae bacterium]
MSVALFTPGDVRAMDQRAVARGVTATMLMERAAGHLARGVLDAGGRGYGLRVAILCGRGNNGGDGLAAGRRLLDQGAAPTVCLVAGDDELSGDATAQLHRYRAAGGRLASSVGDVLAAAEVGVDCMLGTGTAGEPREPYRSAVQELNRTARFAALAVVACDLPTGVDADTGDVPGEAVRADLTVTLGAHKRGLHLWPARGHCGRLVLGDLGIVDPDDEPAATVLEPADLPRLLPALDPNAHKRSRGVVVVLAGSPGMTGAATLVARGAMAAGAGLVTVASSVASVVGPTVPEALTVPLPDGDPDAAFERLAGTLEGADALVVGPGLGRAGPTVALIRRIVAEAAVPLVLDADGLNAFDGDGDALADHASPLLVLTPHAGEFARLVRTGQATGSGTSDDGAWVRRATLVPEKAAAWEAVVVAKGPGTVTGGPDGRVVVNPTGGVMLATGGTGDVLAGMIAALVAQCPDPGAVAAGVYLHGLAGEIAAGGAARSVTAMDVVGAVPAALRAVRAAR